MTETLGPQQAAVDDTSATWHRILRKVGLVYIFSRLCVLAGAAIVAAELQADINQVKGLDQRAVPGSAHHGQTTPVVCRRADQRRAVVVGRHLVPATSSATAIPRHVQDNVTYFVTDARAAFFPAYPMLVRCCRQGAAGRRHACRAVHQLRARRRRHLSARRDGPQLYGEQVAAKAMVLGAMFPGSFVLSFAYTEALLLVLGDGLPVVPDVEAMGRLPACSPRWPPRHAPTAWRWCWPVPSLSFLAIRSERDWKSLAAPLLAPAGFIAFQLWLGHHTGEAGVWFRVQTEAWGEGASYGLTAIRKTVEAFTSPLTSPTNIITAASVMAMVLMIYFAVAQAAAAADGRLHRRGPRLDAAPQHRHRPSALPVHGVSPLHLRGVPSCIPTVVIGGRTSSARAAPAWSRLTALYGVFGAIP